MKRIILQLSLLFIFYTSFCSEEIQKMLDKAWHFYEQGKFEDMKNISSQILEKSLKENYPKGIVEGYYYLGIANFSLGKLPEALKYANKAIQFSEKHNNYKWKAYSHALVGEIFRSLRRYKDALKHFKIAYRLSVKNKNEKMIPPSLMNIGNIYYDLGKFEKAASFYKKALEKAEEVNLRQSYIAFLSYNLGITYYREKDYKNAEKYLRKSISIYKKLKNEKAILEAKFYLGKALMKNGEKEKAKEIFKDIVKSKQKGILYKRAKYFLKKLED